jgi:hypothetical protein
MCSEIWRKCSMNREWCKKSSGTAPLRAYVTFPKLRPLIFERVSFRKSKTTYYEKCNFFFIWEGYFFRRKASWIGNKSKLDNHRFNLLINYHRFFFWLVDQHTLCWYLRSKHVCTYHQFFIFYLAFFHKDLIFVGSFE